MGLVLHPYRDSSAAVAQVAAWTGGRDVQLVADRADVARLGLTGVVAVPAEELAGTCDGIIALGGDGTILGAMRLVSARPVPVLGVNLGHLGFLAEVEGRELDEALTAMAEERVTTETRGCLVVRKGDWEWLAFNDAVLARVPGEGMVRATLSVGDRPYGHFRCDAVILATAMGSTAYNYAAGGPVVSPGVEGILVTPAAPMSGISRTIMLGPDRVAAAVAHRRAAGDGVRRHPRRPGRPRRRDRGLLSPRRRPARPDRGVAGGGAQQGEAVAARPAASCRGSCSSCSRPTSGRSTRRTRLSPERQGPGRGSGSGSGPS